MLLIKFFSPSCMQVALHQIAASTCSIKDFSLSTHTVCYFSMPYIHHPVYISLYMSSLLFYSSQALKLLSIQPINCIQSVVVDKDAFHQNLSYVHTPALPQTPKCYDRHCHPPPDVIASDSQPHTCTSQRWETNPTRWLFASLNVRFESNGTFLPCVQWLTPLLACNTPLFKIRLPFLRSDVF